ncbi:hypothetical protein [Paenibacillus polymyxa]|uniref:hypothetical protein n=1 Tax=Paenibacillus polymyxa TaxID=1406 RepID=UPI000AF820FA|nr:hypothetical protein [Paenibacillus polymyxa]
MKWKEPTFGATPMLKALTTANAHRKAKAFDLAAEQKKQKLNYPDWAQTWMRKYKEDWYIAQANGDEVGMRKAQKLAEGLRSKLREMATFPKWAQEQMQKETVRWMNAEASGNIKQKKAAENAGKALRDKVTLINTIAKTSKADADKLTDFTVKWYTAHDHGIIDGKDLSKDPKTLKAAMDKYSQEAQAIIGKYSKSQPLVEEKPIEKNTPKTTEKTDKPATTQKDDAIQKAIKITASFEGSGYTNIAGNSDNQGLSLGILQWNIGQGTLQPMLISFVNKYNNQAKKIFGENYASLAKALQGSKRDQMNWARSINDNRNKIKPDWKAQLIAMCNTKEFQEIQNKAMDKYINKAYSIANDFNLKTERGLTLAFDIAVQNGGFKQSQTNTIQQKIKSGNLSEQEALKVIAQAAVDKSKAKYREDVSSRKFTIVNGTGTVHGKSYDLQRDFDLTNNHFK